MEAMQSANSAGRSTTDISRAFAATLEADLREKKSHRLKKQGEKGGEGGKREREKRRVAEGSVEDRGQKVSGAIE